MAYNNLIMSKLEYAVIVWDPHTKKNILRLEMIRKRAVGFIYEKCRPTELVWDVSDARK